MSYYGKWNENRCKECSQWRKSICKSCNNNSNSIGKKKGICRGCNQKNKQGDEKYDLILLISKLVVKFLTG